MQSYLQQKQLKAEYLHSEIETLDPSKALRDLRAGKL
jgi:excinuclease UvrABC helicase subunit UvrB